MKGILCGLISFCCIAFAFGKSIVTSRNEVKTLTVKDCGKGMYPASGGDRIVGGEYARHGQYPWMVSMYREDSDFDHHCGASILNEHWVVTAAHCIRYPDEPWRFEVYTGLYKLSQDDGPTVKHYRISKIYVHEDYDSYTDSNDIALLKTERPIDISGPKGYINGICLPNNTQDPTGLARATGWGDTAKYGEMSNILKQVVVPLVDRKKCNELYQRSSTSDRIFDNMICAGQTGRDTCQADSGGPLFQTDENGVSRLIGITSFGRGCGDTHPGVYTNVAHFLDWMSKIILG